MYLRNQIIALQQCSYQVHIDGSAQDCSNFVVSALELPGSGAKPSMYIWACVSLCMCVRETQKMNQYLLRSNKMALYECLYM